MSATYLRLGRDETPAETARMEEILAQPDDDGHGIGRCLCPDCGSTPRICEIRRALEYAPRKAPPSAPGLRGWIARDGSLTVCASCSSRLIARAFGSLLVGMVSTWDDAPATLAPCDGCGGAP